MMIFGGGWNNPSKGMHKSSGEKVTYPDLLGKNSQLFKGTTFRGIYRHKVGKNLYLQASFVGKANLKTVCPVVTENPSLYLL
jgi:hypothetical protein